MALAYTGAVAFFAFGKLFEDRLARFARPVMAGGLAFGFFVAYAAHFVPAMQAVSLPVSIGWMAVSMLAVLVAAESWRSESTAILAIILGHVSAQVSAGAADIYSLVMIGFLALTALLLLLRPARPSIDASPWRSWSSASAGSSRWIPWGCRTRPGSAPS